MVLKSHRKGWFSADSGLGDLCLVYLESCSYGQFVPLNVGVLWVGCLGLSRKPLNSMRLQSLRSAGGR